MFILKLVIMRYAQFPCNNCMMIFLLNFYDQVVHPIHDQSFYLNSEHKRKLKEEFGLFIDLLSIFSLVIFFSGWTCFTGCFFFPKILRN